jgi:hypothetical protein
MGTRNTPPHSCSRHLVHWWREGGYCPSCRQEEVRAAVHTAALRWLGRPIAWGELEYLAINAPGFLGLNNLPLYTTVLSAWHEAHP